MAQMKPQARLAVVVLGVVLLVPGAFAALPSSSPMVQWVNLAQTHVRYIPNIQNQVGPKIYALHANSVWNAMRANRACGYKWNETAIVAFASHTLLTHCFPWWSYKNDILIAAQLAGLPQEQLEGARAIGEAEATKVIASRVGDGFDRWANWYKPAPAGLPSSIGKYQFLPGQTFALYPQYGMSKPCILSRTEIDSVANDYYNRFQGYFQSDEYYSDLNYTRTLGGTYSTARSAYDNDTPLFWAGMPGTSLMLGQFINISISVLPADMTLWKQVRFFTLLTTAVNDANHACFRTKYNVNFWRPATAINLGDGTNKCTADPTWTPYLTVPPHPSYPSGHQCLSGAAVEAIVTTLGYSQVSFSVASESIPGQLRYFTDVRDVLKETTISRILGGLHYRRDNSDGLDLGRDVFKIVQKKFAAWE